MCRARRSGMTAIFPRPVLRPPIPSTKTRAAVPPPSDLRILQHLHERKHHAAAPPRIPPARRGDSYVRCSVPRSDALSILEAREGGCEN